MALTVEWIEDPEEFAGLADGWDALLPGDSHPFDLHCWHLAWWHAFGGSSRLALCTARRGGELVAVLPMREDGRLLKGNVNVHSCVFRPLAADDEAMGAVIAAALKRGARGLELRALPTHDRTVAQLRDAARHAAMLPVIEPSYASPFVDTRGDFESWKKENRHRWKAQLERLWRKMDREFDLELTLVEAPDDLEAELAEGLRLEASGWKGAQGTAIDSSPDTAAFYREVAHVFHARDELRFNRIVLDGTTVSFNFCLLHRDRLYILKSGFDEDYKKLAPGMVLRLAAIGRCFESGDIDTFDLLGDEVGYKTRFASGNRPHVNLRVHSSGPRGRAERVYEVKVRPFLRTLYGRLRSAGVDSGHPRGKDGR